MKKENKNLKSIMVSGYFGFDNCGDEAILMAMIQELAGSLPLENIVVLSHSPQKTKEKYGVNAIPRLNIFSIISHLKKTAVFVSGGGGLLQDVTGKGLSIFYYIGLILLARFLKVPGVFFAQGVGPVRKKINQKLIRMALNKIELILVRDEYSQQFLLELGIQKESVLLCADPSFLLKKEKLPAHIVERYQLNSKSDKQTPDRRIGLVIRNSREIKNDYEQKISQLGEIADYLIEKQQSDLFFLPFQPADDMTLINDIKEKIHHSNHSLVSCFCDDLNPAQMLSLFSKVSLVIGMRLHAIIFATICNTPFVAIDYDPKVRNYVDSLELPELLLKVNQLSVKNIADKLKYIKNNENTVKSVLNSAVKEYQQRADNGMKRLISFIEDRELNLMTGKESKNLD